MRTTDHDTTPERGPSPDQQTNAGGADDAAASERSGVRQAVLAYTLWGLLTLYWKQLDAFSAIELIGWRMLFAATLMAIVVTVRRSWPTLRRHLRVPGAPRRLVAAAMLLSLNWWCYVFAVTSGRVIETALGYFLAPLSTMLFGVLLFGETMRTAQRVAFGLAAAAVVVVSLQSAQVPWVALVIAISWSMYGVTKRGLDLHPLDGLAAETFVLAAPAGVLVALLSSGAGSVVSSATATEWPFVVGTGVVTALPLALFAGAARTVPFTLLGPLNLLVPIINFVLGWLWFGESVPALKFAGFGLVATAVVVVFADRIALTRQSAAHRRHTVRTALQGAVVSDTVPSDESDRTPEPEAAAARSTPVASDPAGPGGRWRRARPRRVFHDRG